MLGSLFSSSTLHSSWGGSCHSRLFRQSTPPLECLLGKVGALLQAGGAWVQRSALAPRMTESNYVSCQLTLPRKRLKDILLSLDSRCCHDDSSHSLNLILHPTSPVFIARVSTASAPALAEITCFPEQIPLAHRNGLKVLCGWMQLTRENVCLRPQREEMSLFPQLP